MYKIKPESLLHLNLPWPPSINHYYGLRVAGKRPVRFIERDGREFRVKVANAAKEHLEHCEQHFTKGTRLAVCVHILSPDRRRRDVDNLCKALLDAMQHAGVYPDDSQIDSLMLLRNPDNIVKGGAVKVVVGVCDGILGE